jgi:putative sterol carrier protein
MSIIDEAVAALNARLSPGLEGCAKFVLEGEGTIVLDARGARSGDEPADVTLIASPETFVAIFEGGLSPMSAYMSGRLRVEGDLGLALRLGTLLGRG